MVDIFREQFFESFAKGDNCELASTERESFNYEDQQKVTLNAKYVC